MRSVISFLLKNLPLVPLLISHVGSSYLNTDVCKFESLQKGESRAQSVDSSKTYSFPLFARVSKNSECEVSLF